MAQEIFSGDIDPEIAALISGPVEEMASSQRKTPISAGASAVTPDFTSLFGDMDVSGENIDRSAPNEIDLTKKQFDPIAKFEDDPPNAFFSDADFYKKALVGEGEEAQSLHQLLSKYFQCTDPKDRSIYRQKLIPTYWQVLKRFALKAASKDFPIQKKVAMRYGALVPSLLGPEHKEIIQRIVFSGTSKEPVYYYDEWVTMVARGQIGASATDEVKAPVRDDRAKYQAQLAKAQGKRDSCESILKAKSEERKQLESLMKERAEFVCSHESLPGFIHIQAPYNDTQKKAMNEVMDIMRRMVAADRELVRNVSDFEDAENDMKSIKDKMNGLSGDTKADLQAVAQEFETMRQMAKMCVGRQGNHFPILCKEYFHHSLKEIGTRENVINALAWIESIDSEAYCRSHKNTLHRIVPYVVLSPNYGDFGICWEPFDRFNRATSRGRIAIPMYPKNLLMAVVTAVADLRWQVAKEKASYYWMEEGLTGNYYQWFTSRKLKGDLKEYFIADYILWITKESDGVQKLDKEVRAIFWRYLPFTKEIKDKLKTRSYIYQELYQKDLNRQMSDGY